MSCMFSLILSKEENGITAINVDRLVLGTRNCTIYIMEFFKDAITQTILHTRNMVPSELMYAMSGNAHIAASNYGLIHTGILMD